jgi:hypothetical protein
MRAKDTKELGVNYTCGLDVYFRVECVCNAIFSVENSKMTSKTHSTLKRTSKLHIQNASVIDQLSKMCEAGGSLKPARRDPAANPPLLPINQTKHLLISLQNYPRVGWMKKIVSRSAAPHATSLIFLVS